VPPLFARLTLGIAGALALGIGAAIAAVPVAFHGFNGLQLPPNADLMSELRAPGAALAVLGALILAGAFYSAWTRASALLGAILFLAYGAGRLIGLTLDGPPSDGLIAAMVLELVFGILCAAVAWPGRRSLRTVAG
jgi:hypothetical protein